MKIKFTLFICSILINTSFAQKAGLVQTFNLEEARQGVAVDSHYFYVINNQSITKHLKSSGKQIARWSDENQSLKHLNSGIIINGKLYCAHSNYPASPMASSIEIFDPKTLKHIGNHSFGINYGSATWVDFYQGSWWVGFAHYTGRGASEGKDNSWTQVVQFDEQWRRTGGWIFPGEIVEKFGSRSNSGAAWNRKDQLYCTGHDAQEIYVFTIPTMGYTLQLEKTISIQAKGQGIALDRSIEDKEVIYGIIKSDNQVVVMELE